MGGGAEREEVIEGGSRRKQGRDEESEGEKQEVREEACVHTFSYQPS